MTKRDAGVIESYNRSSYTELSQCYGSYSSKKQNAWNYCKELCMSKNGSGLRILSRNVYQFTAAFKYEENGKQYLMYISKSEDRPIVLAD